MSHHWIKAILGDLVRLTLVQLYLTLNQFSHKSGFLVSYLGPLWAQRTYILTKFWSHLVYKGMPSFIWIPICISVRKLMYHLRKDIYLHIISKGVSLKFLWIPWCCVGMTECKCWNPPWERYNVVGLLLYFRECNWLECGGRALGSQSWESGFEPWSWRATILSMSSLH